MRHVIFAVLAAFLLSACAAGNSHDYSRLVRVKVDGAGRQVAIGVLDNRPFIRNGDKRPNFVGLQRDGWGIPFNVKTESGKPLSIDMGGTMATSLKVSGFKTKLVGLAVNTGPQAALRMLRTAEGERLVLLTVNRWKADTFVNPKLAYDMKLRIFNQGGDLLLDKTFRDERKLRGWSWTPMGTAKKVVPIAFEKAIRDMLEDEEVAAALTADDPQVVQTFADIPADQAPMLWDLAF